MLNMNHWLNKDYSKMTDDELRKAHIYWSGCVEEAAGWASAYESAKQLKYVCAEGAKRSLGMTNPYPIRFGS